MMSRWFLRGAIICSIFHFIGKFGKASVAIKQPMDTKYLDESNVLNVPSGEKAYKMINKHISDSFKQENAKNVYKHTNDYGPGKFFYQKYLNIGKPKDKDFDYGNVIEDFNSQEKKNDNSLVVTELYASVENVPKTQVWSLLPDVAMNNNKTEDGLKAHTEGGVQTTQLLSEMLPKGINEVVQCSKKEKSVQEVPLIYNLKYPKDLPTVIPDQNITNQSTYNGRVTNTKDRTWNRENNKDSGMNLMGKYQLKQSENNLQDLNKNSMANAKNKVTNYVQNLNKEEKYKNNNRINLINNLTYDDNKNIKMKEGEREEKSYKLQLKDRRRVRSCELKMEDLRESFIPNEQLSIYHPKQSMVDQFILSDTMF